MGSGTSAGWEACRRASGAAATVLAFLSALVAIADHGWAAATSAFIAAGCGALALTALRYGRHSSCHRVILSALLLTALATAIIALTAGGSPAERRGPLQREETERTDTTHSAKTSLGPPRPVGVHPRQLAAWDREVWSLADSGLSYIDSRTRQGGEVFNLPGRLERADYVAILGTALVVVRGGRALFFDTRTRRKFRHSIHFSEGPGRVALTPGVAWLCNEWHSKVDRFDWGSGEFDELESPGRPTRIIAHGPYVWVSVETGWIVRFDIDTGTSTRYPVPSHPDALAIGFGYIWVTYPDTRSVVTVNLVTGKVGTPIRVAGDPRAIAVTRRNVWVAGGATNKLQRISPARRRVVESLRVLGTPSDLIKLRGRLFVSLLEAGTVREVIPGRGA